MSTDVLTAAPVALPLAGAAVSVLLHRRVVAQQVLGCGVLAALLAIDVLLLGTVRSDGTTTSDLGGWPAPVGITLAVDLFSAIMLVVSALMLLVVFVYSLGSPAATNSRQFFHPVYLVLAAGVSAAFVTGDLFNLFVAFEMTLISSYVLITLGGGATQVRSSITYVVVNLIASTMFIAGLAFVYGATGTVNLAHLVERLGDLPTGTRTALGLWFLVVFGTKAAIFPLFFWLPDSYPKAPAPVTAIFAALLTKVGVYAIIRTQTLLVPELDGTSSLLLWLGGLTMVVGVLGAMAQTGMKRILSFHIVSQIGYMVAGIGLFSVAGFAAAIYFTVHNILAKSSMLLVAGMVEETAGSSELEEVGGLARRTPFIALLYALPALAMAGIPPLSGFVAKLGLVQAGMDRQAWVIVGVSLGVSLFTLFSMTKMWNGVFWGEPSGPTLPEDGPVRAPRPMTMATTACVTASVALALLAGPAYRLATDAAASLADRDGYRVAVLGEAADPHPVPPAAQPLATAAEEAP